MKIDLVACEGPIAREISGLSKLEAALPKKWFGYANREIAIGKRSAAEIDLLIVGDDRIYVVDLKDWNGVLEVDGGRWLQNGAPRGRSAVRKVRENAKKIGQYFKSRLPPKVGSVFTEGFVVVSGNLDFSSLPDDEKLGILRLEEFASLSDPQIRSKLLDDVFRSKLATPLTEFHAEFDLLMRVSSAVKPRVFRPFGFDLEPTPESAHRSGLYREFSGLSSTGDRGVIRHWDFSKLPISMQEANARNEILTRETSVRDFLALHSPLFEADEWAVKRIAVEDDLELFEQPRALARAARYLGKAGATITSMERLDKLKALVATIAELHRLGCAHTDLSAYSVWLGSGTRHKLSNLASARVPSAQTLGPQRYLLAGLQHDPLSGPEPQQMDLTSLADLGVSILTPLSGESDDSIAPLIKVLERARVPGAFKDAGCLLDALNEADSRSFNGAQATRELSERVVSSTNPYVAYPPNGPIQTRGDQLIYASTLGGKDVVVKIWNSVNNSSAPERIFSALPAFLKARAIMESRHQAFAPVLDCGIGQGGSFVVLEKIEGDEFGSKQKSPKQALEVFQSLVEQVSLAHEANLAHGDLAPSNIRMMPNASGGLTPLFIDFVQVPNGPMDYTPKYSPQSECDDFQRDAFAVAKIAAELLEPFKEHSGPSKSVLDLLAKELGDGWRDPSLFIAKIGAAFIAPPQPEPQTKFCFPVATLSGPIDLESDGGCYYIRYIPGKTGQQATLIINGLTHALKLPVDETDSLLASHGRIGTVDGSLLGKLRMFTPKGAQLRTAAIQLTPLHNSVGTASIEAAKQWLRDAREPHEALRSRDVKADNEVARRPLNRQEAWQVFAQAEDEARFEVRISGTPHVNGDNLMIPVFPWQVPEDATTLRSVYRVNRHHEEVELGDLALGLSGPKLVAVEGVGLGDIPPSSLPLLVIRDRRNESARSKKVAAAKRLVANDGARSNLLEQFNALAQRTDARHVGEPIQKRVEAEDVLPYGLNDDQRSAVLGALNGDGLFLLQGPPGTGKTKTIAAIVHLIATKLGSRRILVASQTHEAVNNAASRIAETFQSLGTTLDLVRVGNEDDVGDDLLSVHTAALRRDFVSLLNAEWEVRLRPIGREIGIRDDSITALFSCHRLIIEPLERSASWLRSAGPHQTHGRMDDLRKNAFAAFAEKFPSSPPLTTDVLAARVQVATLVATCADDASPDQCRRFLDVVSAAGDTLRRLSGGASDATFGEFLVKTRAIACGTCVGIGSSAFKLADKVFDWVIVDEAARCTPTELAVAIQSAKRIILVGDHLQLPAFIGPEVKAALQRILDAKDVSSWCKSDFEQMFNQNDDDKHCASLWEQYRMVQPISDLVSDLAYDKKLKCKKLAAEPWVMKLPEVGLCPVTLVDTSCAPPSERKRKGSTSFYNLVEANWIVGWIQKIVSDKELLEEILVATEASDQAGIGVICAYADQVKVIRDRLFEIGLDELCARFIKIGTVDSYQGRENAVIVVSLVRSNDSNSVGHVNLFQRINVALSRSKERLIVVGDARTWQASDNLHYLAARAWSYVSERAGSNGYQLVTSHEHGGPHER